MNPLKVLLGFLLIAVPISLSAAHDDDPYVVVLNTGLGNDSHNQKSGDVVPIKCLVYSLDRFVCIQSQSIFQQARVEISNLDTGIDSVYDVIISQTDISLPIISAGTYNIDIILADGRVFSGLFTI